MTNYRRLFIKGASYFFTVTAANRSSRIFIDRIDSLREAFTEVKKTMPFNLTAIVVLPEHLHTIWTLPENDIDYPTRWKKIKAHFSRRIPKEENRSKSLIAKGERGIWQRRYWEHVLRDENDFARHMDYIHFNPVKHGYAACANDWAYSSFHRYVKAGIYTEDWASLANNELIVGE